MMLTIEQQTIVDTIESTNCNLLAISAVAGSGKTHTLIAIAEKLMPERGLYLAYNKAIATEATGKFPHYIDCRTVHSLAYRYVTTLNRNYRIDFFTPRCISERMPYIAKLEIVAAIDEFCLSSELDPTTFFNRELSADYAIVASKYLSKMINAEIPVTFSFMLKYFHLQLNAGVITPPPYDILFLDEAGDTSGVIFEIFMSLPATKKVMVGDPCQNIYTFAYTINCFEKLPDTAVILPLSTSFRNSPSIAKDIEKFCQATISPNMHFIGTEQTPQNNTMAYISRTNSGLISRIIELNKTDTIYSFTRDVKEIFSLVLSIMTIKEDTVIYDKRYAYLPAEFKKYNTDDKLQQEFKTFKHYLSANYAENDLVLRSALNVLFKYNYKLIFDTYNTAKAMPKNTLITLTTAHSAKGLEWESVYIEDDLNKSCERAKPVKVNTEEALAELRLYYVACTRARIHLHNAKELHVNTTKIGT